MNKGIELLMKRMKSNPEEFAHVPRDDHMGTSPPPKWWRFTAPILKIAEQDPETKANVMWRWVSEEDAKSFKYAYQIACGEAFHQKVMQELLRDDADEGAGTASGRYTADTAYGIRDTSMIRLNRPDAWTTISTSTGDVSTIIDADVKLGNSGVTIQDILDEFADRKRGA